MKYCLAGSMDEAEDVTLRYQGRVFVCLLLIFFALLLNFTQLFSISLRPVYLVQSVGTLQCETRSPADLGRTRGIIIHLDSFGFLQQHVEFERWRAARLTLSLQGLCFVAQKYHISRLV